MQAEGLLRVACDRLHQVLLVTALRDAERDQGTAPFAEPLRDGCRAGLVVAGQRGDQHLLGHGVAALLPVELLERVLDQFPGPHGLDLVGDPAALPAHASAAHVEDLHGRLQFVLGDGDEVRVGGIGQHHRVLLHGTRQGAYVVTQACRALVLHLLRRLGHLPLQAAQVGAGPARHEVAELLGEFAVLLGVTRPTQGAEHLPM